MEETEQQQTQQPEQAEQPTPPPVDWEAKYREAVEHSRKHEARAKANYEKAKAYDELAEKAEADAKRAAEAETELAVLRAEAAHAAKVAEVAKAKNVDADLLAAMRADTAEELEAAAEKLAASYAARSLYPSVTDRGATRSPAMTAESIDAIKDPMERLRARMDNAHIYR